MAQSMWEQTGDQFSDVAHKASRAATSVAGAIEDGVASARRAAKQGGDAAAELIDDTKQRVKQYPVEAVAITLAVGIAAGAVIGLLLKRR
jgi:ElaB/YqjD/DUF883 family membrane-anchored ribosome-binding protein